MKKYFMVLVVGLLIIWGLSGLASAHDTRASDYIVSCSISLTPLGDGDMLASFTVQATGLMDEVGAREILIEKKVNGQWVEHTTLSHKDYPGFIAKNARVCNKSQSFEGIVGMQFQATLTAYAVDDTGSDTSFATSSAKICY